MIIIKLVLDFEMANILKTHLLFYRKTQPAWDGKRSCYKQRIIGLDTAKQNLIEENVLGADCIFLNSSTMMVTLGGFSKQLYDIQE